MLLPCRRMYAVRKKRALFEDSYAARWGCILYHTKWRVLLDHEKDSRKTSTMATTSTSEATTPQTQDDKVRHVLQSCKHLAELAFEKTREQYLRRVQNIAHLIQTWEQGQDVEVVPVHADAASEDLQQA